MLFLSWSWNGLSYSRMISATTKLRYLYLLLPRATKAESCSVEINHPRAYLLPRKYVNRKWPLCWGKGPGGHVQGCKEKQRINSVLNAQTLFVHLNVRVHQQQHTCRRAASEQKAAVPAVLTTSQKAHTIPHPLITRAQQSRNRLHKITFLFHLSSHNVKYHTLPHWKNIFWVAPSAPTGTLQVQLVTIAAICLYSSAVNWTPHKPGAWTSTNTRVTPQTIWNAQ